MLFFFIALSVTIIIAALTFNFIGTSYGYNEERYTYAHWIAWSLIPMYTWLVIATIAVLASYGSYLDIRAFNDRVHYQYRDAITLYGDKAVVINVQKASALTLTDFGSQGYQAEMAGFVKELRDKVAWYNELSVKKNFMNKNLWFNWYIIPPDPDMKMISLIDK